MNKVVHVGLLGFGTVGGGVVQIFQNNAAMMARKTGADNLMLVPGTAGKRWSSSRYRALSVGQLRRNRARSLAYARAKLASLPCCCTASRSINDQRSCSQNRLCPLRSP